MAHFFVPPKNFSGKKFFFGPSESRHISKVLRKKSGDVIRVFDGSGTVCDARITDVSDAGRVQGEIAGARTAPERGGLRSKSGRALHVFPALIKGPRFDWMIEKLTELAVSSIHPILTERTIVRLKGDQGPAKVKRWEAIALSAAKQCGRADFARIFPPVSFSSALASVSKDDLNLMLWESEENQPISQALSQSPGASAVNLFVGPEGGLSVAEADAARRSGILPVHLGENILRAETAALAGASYILLAWSWHQIP